MNIKLNLIALFYYILMLVFITPTYTLAANNFVAWDKKDDQWLQQSSEHFSVNYLKKHQQHASNVLKIAEQVHHQLQPFFNVTPEKRTQIILLDDIDYLRTHESSLEYGEIRLVMSPVTSNNVIETEDD